MRHRLWTGAGGPLVAAWTTERVWDAVDARRWIPPSAKRVVTDAYELVVTPGSYALTYVYGFHADTSEQADDRLVDLRSQIEALGGTGACFQLIPRSRPDDLAARLLRHGYRLAEEADVLIWELVDTEGKPVLPEFASPASVSVREAISEPEFEAFVELSGPIFGDPVPPVEARSGFLAEFRRKLRVEGHSDRFLAWEGTRPIGRAGMEIAGSVARFWGTGVRPEHRGRGVYGALVRERCESALRRGAELVLGTARAGTSGPILKRHGFRPMGAVQVFEVQW